jgi:hypothetical protein
MEDIKKRAQGLREAEIELRVAQQRSAELERARLPWQKLSPRRSATLYGILSLLEDAAEKCRALGSDPQTALAAAIRDLGAKTRAQRRNLLAAYGIIAVAALVAGAIVCWNVGAMSRGDSPNITDPKAGDAVDMTISVSGSSPRESLPPGMNLYVLVKPEEFDYWLQPPPEVSLTGWRVEKAGIGDKLEDRGKHFLICALIARKVLSTGWSGRELPPGDAHCIDVTRK